MKAEREKKKSTTQQKGDMYCPECGAKLIPAEGCTYCPFCGWSACK